MKKYLIAFLFICLLTGCKSKEKTMVCEIKKSQSDISIETSYKVNYSDKYVTKIESKEKITSTNSNLLNQYKSAIESTLSPYKNIKYYSYTIKIDGDTLIDTTDIDYSKIDTNKLIEADSSNKQIIKNGKVLVNDIESVYTQIGATCKK